MSVIKNIGFVYIRLLIVMLLSLVTSGYILRNLGANDYGLYSVVGGVVILLAFLNNAMAVTTQRYLSVHINNSEELVDIFKISKSIHLGISLIVLLLGESIGIYFLNNYLNFSADRILAVNIVYQFSLFSIIIMILNVPYLSILLVGQKVNFYAFVGVIEAILKFFLAYCLIFVESDKLIFYAVILFLISLFVSGSYYFYSIRIFSAIKNVGYSFNFKQAKEMVSFAIWNLIGVLAGLGQNVGVNVLLNIYFKPEISASRALSLQIYNAFNTITSNAQLVYNPLIMRGYVEKEQNYEKYIFIFSKLGFFILALIIIPVFFYLEPLLVLWLKKVPIFLEIFIKIMLLELLISSLIGPLHSLIQATGNIKRYQFVVSGLLLLNIPIGFLLYENGFSPEKIYYVSCALVFLGFIVRLFLLRIMKLINLFKYFLEVIFPIGTIVLFIYMVNYFLNISDFNKTLISESFVLIVILFLVWNSKDIRNMLLKFKR